MSRHSEGLGSRNASNSPDWMNVRCPSIINEYLSNVTVCGMPPDMVPGCASSIRPTAAALLTPAAWLPSAAAARATVGEVEAAAAATVITPAAAIRPRAWRRRRKACRKHSRPARLNMGPPGVPCWEGAPSEGALMRSNRSHQGPPEPNSFAPFIRRRPRPVNHLQRRRSRVILLRMYWGELCGRLRQPLRADGAGDGVSEPVRITLERPALGKDQPFVGVDREVVPQHVANLTTARWILSFRRRTRPSR